MTFMECIYCDICRRDTTLVHGKIRKHNKFRSWVANKIYVFSVIICSHICNKFLNILLKQKIFLIIIKDIHVYLFKIELQLFFFYFQKYLFAQEYNLFKNLFSNIFDFLILSPRNYKLICLKRKQFGRNKKNVYNKLLCLLSSYLKVFSLGLTSDKFA